VLVATGAAVLAEERGDLWDSGKTAASRSPRVAYTGAPLRPGQVYHWQVRCWDAAGRVSPWSAPASFEVAPAAPADWHGARWIDDGKALPERDEDFYKDDPAPLLRHEFTLAKPVTRARLHVAGLGYCLASLNGERLADQALDPPWTAFERRILFRTHDVTGQLAEGANCLGLALGNGWFNPLPLRMWGRRNIRDTVAIGRPRAIACLVADHPDGTSTIITTGPGWTTAEGPTLQNSIFLGETRDARRNRPGWDRPGHDAAGWRPARVADAPLEPLAPLLAMPPVRAGAPLLPIKVTSPAAGVHIVDFGRNFTGVPDLDLAVPAGTRLTLRYGELLNADGTLNPMTSVCGQIKGTRKDDAGNEVPVGGPGAPPIAWQQDTYIAAAARPANDSARISPSMPSATWKSAACRRPPSPPPAVASRCTPTSPTPASSSLPTSCSTASRKCAAAPSYRQRRQRPVRLPAPRTLRLWRRHRRHQRDVHDELRHAGFYAKTVRDFADAARPDGNFTDTAPFVGIQYCGVGWAMVHPLLLEQLHSHYGDLDLVREQLPAALRWFDGEAARRKDGLVVQGLGDHESLPRVAGPAITTPMFIDSRPPLARLARLAGRPGDAARCDKSPMNPPPPGPRPSSTPPPARSAAARSRNWPSPWASAPPRPPPARPCSPASSITSPPRPTARA
jgi:alpha-L-rhamnosidase